MTIRPAGKLRIAPKHLCILILPVLVLVASELLLGAFGDTGLVIGPVDLVEHAALVELSWRYTFLAVFFFYFAVALVVIAVFLIELLSRHRPKSIRDTSVAMIIVIGISLIFSMIEPAWMGSFESYQLVGADLFQATLGQGQMPACLATANMGCDGRGSFFAMTYLMDKVNLITSFAAASVIAGLVLTLARSAPVELSTQAGRKAESDALASSQQALRRYLYLSGVLLTTGMALGLAWMKWPQAMIADEALRDVYASLVDSISMFRGVSYSVLILSYYMPVMLILMVRINRCAEAGSGNMQTLEDAGVTQIKTLDAFKAILAILSPVIASAVGSFANFSVFG